MLYLLSKKEIEERIRKREVTICVVGIGTIGLPLATFFAEKGFNVKGLDVDEEKVKAVNRGTYGFEYTSMLRKVVSVYFYLN